MAEATATIQFTPVKLALLKMAYTNATTRGDVIFTFEGNELLTQYAKYLIEYLDSQFKKQ